MSLLLAALRGVHPKVAAGGAAGAVVTLVVMALGFFGISIPTDVSAAAVTVISFVAAWLKPHNSALVQSGDAQDNGDVTPGAKA